MKKKLATLVLSGLFALTSLSTAFAGSWIQDSVGWWWQNDDGTWPANQWVWIDGNNDGNFESYYFNESGYCLMNTVTPDGFYVDASGAWIGQTKTFDELPASVPYATATPLKPSETTASDVVLVSEESNWTANMPYVSGMIQNKPAEGSFWTVNINTGKYHGTSYVENLLPENTRYYAGDAATLESYGYSRCKKRGCY